MTTLRFGRPRAGSRYASAALTRRPWRIVRLLGAGPSIRGPLWSPEGGNPASSAARMNASATGCSRSGSQTVMGPAAP